MDSIKDIQDFGIRARGRAERIKFLEGKPLTRAEAILAHCYQCTGGYDDGAQDCEIESCSLRQHMPYAKRKDKVKPVRTEKQKENDSQLYLIPPSTKNDLRLNITNMTRMSL
jgi:hypothetical protein